EWALVSGGLFGTRSHFVPLAGVDSTEEGLRAAVTKDQVKAAPGVENEQELSESEEQRLFDHYGVPYTGEGSTTAQGGPENGASGSDGHDVSGPTTDDAMTRSE